MATCKKRNMMSMSTRFGGRCPQYLGDLVFGPWLELESLECGDHIIIGDVVKNLDRRASKQTSGATVAAPLWGRAKNLYMVAAELSLKMKIEDEDEDRR